MNEAMMKSITRNRTVTSPHRGTRCGLCYWSLYDGSWCQNPKCKFSGKVPPHTIKLTNSEAVCLINHISTCYNRVASFGCNNFLDGLEMCAAFHQLLGVKHRDERRFRIRCNIGPPYPKQHEIDHFTWAKQISQSIDFLKRAASHSD